MLPVLLMGTGERSAYAECPNEEGPRAPAANQSMLKVPGPAELLRLSPEERDAILAGFDGFLEALDSAGGPELMDRMAAALRQTVDSPSKRDKLDRFLGYVEGVIHNGSVSIPRHRAVGALLAAVYGREGIIPSYGGVRVKQNLVACLEDPEYQVRREAARALGWVAFNDLSQADEIRAKLEASLGREMSLPYPAELEFARLGTTAALRNAIALIDRQFAPGVPPVERIRQDQIDAVRQMPCQQLGEILRGPALLRAVLDAAFTTFVQRMGTEPAACGEILEWAAAMDDWPHWQPLKCALPFLRTAPDSPERRAVIDRYLGFFEAALDCRPGDLNARAAAQCLAGLFGAVPGMQKTGYGTDEAMAVLLRNMRHPLPGVRESVVGALGSIGPVCPTQELIDRLREERRWEESTGPSVDAGGMTQRLAAMDFAIESVKRVLEAASRAPAGIPYLDELRSSELGSRTNAIALLVRWGKHNLDYAEEVIATLETQREYEATASDYPVEDVRQSNIRYIEMAITETRDLLAESGRSKAN